ncbi:MAG: polyprenol monophosphomannose synthase [Chloroflexota bacterium]|nr:polyprenol monophosphomannose synthase [Chloroflexota bacterium]
MAGSPPHLSVVVPTYNERENVAVLVPRILGALHDIECEVIVVDDASPDGTADAVRELARADGRVRLLAREGKLGLSSAAFAGAEAARGAYVCVMDGDLSHDPMELPQMLAVAQEGAHVVIGSRFAPGGMLVNVAFTRRVVSVVANLAARALNGLGVRDVLSGFALCERRVLTEAPTRYSARGFKFLLEVLATQRQLTVREWPIAFRDRRKGSSKATLREGYELAALCARLTAWRVRRRLRRGRTWN